MADGIVERDPETGRIVKSVLSSERAKEIRAMKKDTNPLAESDVETLIIEGGYDLEDAPLAFRKVCEQIVAGGARSIQAVVEWRRWTDRMTGVVTSAQPYICSRCRTEFLHKEVGNEVFEQLIDILRPEVTSEDVQEAPLAPTNGDSV